MKVRIELHLDLKDVQALDKLAKADNRNRKNFCENELLKVIEANNLKSIGNHAKK